MLVPTYQTGRCCNPCDHSIDISHVLQQIDISASVKRDSVSRGYFGEEDCLIEGSRIRCQDPVQHQILCTMLFRNVRMHRVLLTANCEVFALYKHVVKTNVDYCVGGFRCGCYFLW